MLDTIAIIVLAIFIAFGNFLRLETHFLSKVGRNILTLSEHDIRYLLNSFLLLIVEVVTAGSVMMLLSLDIDPSNWLVYPTAVFYGYFGEDITNSIVKYLKEK